MPLKHRVGRPAEVAAHFVLVAVNTLGVARLGTQPDKPVSGIDSCARKKGAQMDFRFGGELPDDHVFLTRIRSLVDWSFKFVSWLIITGTLGVAAHATSNTWLWSLYGLCQLLLFLFLQTFFDWLFKMKFPGRKSARPERLAPRSRVWIWIHKFQRALIAIFAFVLWAGFQLAMQQAISRTVDAVSDYQRTIRK